MHADQFIAGIGKATFCAVSDAHRPKVYRFVWHHLLPQVCGGKTETDNLVSLCDSCHYTVHILLYELAQNTGNFVLPDKGTKKQRNFATTGYQAAVAAGTVDKIPKEADVG